jgi:glycosyltransferase involved in cell wall biosynthesis
LGAAYYAKKYNIPYCISPRGSLVDGLIRKKSRFRKLIYLALFEKRSLRRAKFVHATSELESTEIRLLNIGIKNIEVVPNGINLSEYDLPNSTVHCGVSYILYLGRISWKKRIDLLLMAMPYINKQFELVIAGNDEEGELLKLTNVLKELQIENRVHFVGFIEGLKKVELIKNSSLLVLPSENENFGNVILEAWACRKPVAISKHVGLAE